MQNQTKKVTRQEYMSGNATHEEYYGQFLTPEIISLVRESIGENRIKASTDPHFNDIALISWDRLQPIISPRIVSRMREVATGGVSLSDCVCVAKAAAREIKAGAV